MKQQRRIFIGYDSPHPEAYHVCRQSMIDHGADPNIIYPLVLRDLEKLGLYWRPPQGSTEFSFTRFLVPYLSGYYGHSLFCDADFLWRSNPEDLIDFVELRGESVHVVKHQLRGYEHGNTKMIDKHQHWYPRKNWSSLMVFNNSMPECMTLKPTVVSESEASYLHELEWVKSCDIGELPMTYNYLVGYAGYEHIKEPKAVHFTDGGPWLDGYKDVDYAGEWMSVQQRIERSSR